RSDRRRRVHVRERRELRRRDDRCARLRIVRRGDRAFRQHGNRDSRHRHPDGCGRMAGRIAARCPARAECRRRGARLRQGHLSERSAAARGHRHVAHGLADGPMTGTRMNLESTISRSAPMHLGAGRAAFRGFSLIELMVALVIAGLLLLGMSAYFVSSSRTFSETERTSRQIENGRYAASLLREEIRHAGFYGEVGNVVNLPVTAAIPMPTTLPGVCDSTLAAVKA